MSRVERAASVTLVSLVYRDTRWLRWMMESVDRAATRIDYRWLIVANDATDEVIEDVRRGGYDSIDFRNEDPNEYYINRVYRAWNEGVAAATTPLVVMLNSDMAASDYWLDELLFHKQEDWMVVPTSLLVESGRIPSAMPEYVRDFGVTPEGFHKKGWESHAADLYDRGRGKIEEPGRLYMPILVDRQEFFDVGGYPEGNPPGTTGDKDLIARYAAEGYRHVTAMGSIVYHVQTAEMDGL